jgi:hypothetical protein
MELFHIKGRAIAQAISRWLTTEAGRVRAQVWSYRICGGQSGTGARFLKKKTNYSTLRRTIRTSLLKYYQVAITDWTGEVNFS